MHVAILGTYPPTQCGIATFTADVESSLGLHGTDVTIVPISPEPSDDPAQITRDDPDSYARAARRVSTSGCEVLWPGGQ